MDAQTQEDELVVLESIYPDQLICHSATDISIRIDIALATPTRIVCQSRGTSDEPLAGSGKADSIAITTPVLPPVYARLHLPPTYPSSSAPRITSLDPPDGTSWLPSRTADRLSHQLQTLWAAGEGEGILWTWIDWIATGGFLDGATSDEDITRQGETYIIPTPTPTTLHTLLRHQITHTTSLTFLATSFSCGICFDSKKGRGCTSIPCARSCVFCTECLRACWTLAIREGAVEGVACPGWECTKDRARQDELEQGFVRGVVGEELGTRFVWLKEKKRVETDPTYTICPLPHCQAPVPPPSTPHSTAHPKKTARIFRLAPSTTDTAPTDRPQCPEDPEPPDDRFRQCPTCQFSFCRYCTKTWHGTAPCPLPATASFLQKYMSLPSGSAERAAFERRYGRKQLARMVDEWEEQQANKEWFDRFTRACPGCQTRVNKSAGCNHMTCSKCQAHFCYRCGTKLRPADPYHHYRTPGSSCFEKLFDADEIARFEREVEAVPEDLGMADWIQDVFPLQGNGGWW